jgi:hypothetical protein
MRLTTLDPQAISRDNSIFVGGCDAGYERIAETVPEHIAMNNDMSTLGSDCSMCGNAQSTCRELIDSLHQYSEAVGDLAKWSGKYMTGVKSLCMLCERKQNEGNSVKKLLVLMRDTERRMIHERNMLLESLENIKRLLLVSRIKEAGVFVSDSPTVSFRIVNIFDFLNLSVSECFKSIYR